MGQNISIDLMILLMSPLFAMTPIHAAIFGLVRTPQTIRNISSIFMDFAAHDPKGFTRYKFVSRLTVSTNDGVGLTATSELTAYPYLSIIAPRRLFFLL